MHTVNEAVLAAPRELCFRAAADVEAWPEVLPHYRWVHFRHKEAFGRGRVEMAARRQFGPLGYPVWWVSKMTIDAGAPAVLYDHVEGITTGMRVAWTFESSDPDKTRVRIIHEWDEGPDWPLPRALRRWIANRIIGPIFIHHVASRTLAGIRAHAERIYFETTPQVTP